jgi:Htaa
VLPIKHRFAAAATGCALVLTGSALGVTSAAAHPATPSHHAAKHRPATLIVFTGGVTMLRLAPSTASALTSNGVSVAPVSEAKVVPSGIAFPIQGGVINAKTLAGTITHDGGLSFTAGGKSLTIRDFTVSTTKGTLSAYVDQAKARIKVLDLSLAKAKIAAHPHKLVVTKITATLDAAAAGALNDYFSTTLFTKGLAIGTVRVSATTLEATS